MKKVGIITCKKLFNKIEDDTIIMNFLNSN